MSALTARHLCTAYDVDYDTDPLAPTCTVCKRRWWVERDHAGKALRFRTFPPLAGTTTTRSSR